MVDLLVYTNHRMGDMYYNTPFPHNVLSIVTVLDFLLRPFIFREMVFTTRSEVIVHYYVGSNRRYEEKGFVLDPVYI